MGSSSREFNSMAADPSKVCYFSLPGEVRNKIMDLVLVHGDVHICTRSDSSADPSASVNTQAGIQLIATNKNAYSEGHAIFYSSNTFHLPPTMTFEWSNRLQPTHRAMIKRVGITLGLDDLTAAMINEIDETASTERIRDKRSHLLGEVVFDALFSAWETKFRHIAAWKSLEQIELSTFNQTHVLQHHEFVANLGQIDRWYGILYWRRPLRWAQIGVFGNIMAQADRVGWKKTVEWLRVRKPGEMAEGFWDHGVMKIEPGRLGI